MSVKQTATGKTDYGTPQAIVDELAKRWGFTIDACALAHNAKLPRFFTPEVDGLRQPWIGMVWCNPPYGRGIAAWTRKARAEVLAGRCGVVMLVPANVGTAWWRELVAPLGRHRCSGRDQETDTTIVVGTMGMVEYHHHHGRITFDGADEGAQFDTAIVALYPHRFGRTLE